MSQAPAHRVAVIGAGLAGLSAAAELAAAGARVVVFEKSRGPGGRLATRRPFRDDGDPARAALGLDHGAPAAHGLQNVDTPDRALRAVAAWGDAPWPTDPRETSPAWVALDGAASLAAIVSDMAGVTLRASTTITDVARGEEDFLLRAQDADAPLGPFDAIVSAIPPAQARALLGAVAPAKEFDADMRAVATVMLVAPRRSETMATPAFVAPTDGPLEKIFRESAKPGRSAWPSDLDGWVAHADRAWSEEAMDRSKEAIASDLSAAMWRALGASPAEPIYSAGHRWRYAYAERPIGRAFWLSEDGRLGLCGDWRLGPCAGDARRSGLMLGRRMAAALTGGAAR